MILKITLLAFLLLLSGCASNHSKIMGADKGNVGFPLTADITLASPLTRSSHEIGTYISSWHGFRTSSYWINAPEGLVIIDTQFLPSAAEEMLNWAEQVTGKKAVLAVVLHSNPDKFNGTSVFQKRGIKVITSEQVLKLIPAVHKLRTGWFYERFKPDYPTEEPKPESFGNKTTEISVAGIQLKLHVMGPGCSGAHVVAQYKNNLFVGDLVTQGFHSWLELGQVPEWLQRIRELKALKAKAIYTGRGAGGDAELLDREEQYLKTVLRVVNKHHPKKGTEISEATTKKIVDEMVALYPAYEYPLFVENGLEALWQRLAK